LKESKDSKDYTWLYTGRLTGFKGYLNKVADYAHSSDVLKWIWEHCASRGVKFVLGEIVRKAVELLYAGDVPEATSESPRARNRIVRPGREDASELAQQTARAISLTR